MSRTGPSFLPHCITAMAGAAETAILQMLQNPDPQPTEALADCVRGSDSALPLRKLADGLGLDDCEAGLLALLFAAELSEPTARAIHARCNSGGRGVPYWLAARLVQGLSPRTVAGAAPLPLFGIIEVEERSVRIEAILRLRQPVLDRLCGADVREPEVAARIALIPPVPALRNGALSKQIATALTVRGPDRLSPLLISPNSDVAMLGASLAALGLRPFVLSGSDIPSDPEQRDRLARYWSRDAALDRAALVLTMDEQSHHAAAEFANRVAGHVIICGSVSGTCFRRSVRVLAGNDGAGLADRWRRLLGSSRARKLGRGIDRVANQFRLEPAEIDAVCARVAADIDSAPDGENAGRRLWHAASRAAMPAPVPGVKLVEPAYEWRDLVLPPALENALRKLESHVRHATTVMDEWGFAERLGGRGRGVSALFSGPSGTGKTMAAEVIASSLDLRMMLIDLSQIISKFVGETSKNIAAAFHHAERTGAVMVWNEGDAVWGARGSVGHATDRHVNAEVGDLLQRIEAFRGFTIVTTNMRHSIDPAFLRRFRFMIDFPMPSQDERLRLWQQAFPRAAPIEALDWSVLARLPLSGGSICNVALASAFAAAERGCAIDRGLVESELAEELRKQDQTVTALDWGAMG